MFQSLEQRHPCGIAPAFLAKDRESVVGAVPGENNLKVTQKSVNSYFKQCFPRFQKYPIWDFFAKRSLWGSFSVEDGR